MNNLPSKEDFDNLKNELSKVKKELDISKETNSVNLTQQIDNTEEIFSKIFEKGIVVFEQWNNSQTEIQKYSIDKHHITESKKIETIDKIDKRSNNFKMTLIILVVICFTILTAIEKSNESVVAIFVLIISTLLSNNIKDFFKNIHQGFGKSNDN